MESISRRCDILTVYFDADEGSVYTVLFRTGSLIMEIVCGVIVTGASAPLLKPSFTELGNRLRDWLFGETSPREDTPPLSQITQKWLENLSRDNTKLLTELTDLSRNLKDLNRTVPQLTDVLQKNGRRH